MSRMEIIIFVHNTKRHSERVKDKMDHRMENTEEQQPEKSDAKDSIMSKIQQLGEHLCRKCPKIPIFTA